MDDWEWLELSLELKVRQTDYILDFDELDFHSENAVRTACACSVMY